MLAGAADAIAGSYSAGSLIIGSLMIVDGAVLLRRGGAFDVGPNGEALGLTYFLMIALSGWAGFSLLALISTSRPGLPIFYLVFAGLNYWAGRIEYRAKGVVKGVPLWLVRINLVAAVIFTVAAVYEVVVTFKLID